MRRIWLGAAAVLMMLGGERASAHPHVFLDGGAHFIFDDQGRLSAIRVIWEYDAFATLFILETLEVDGDADGVLTEEETAKVLADQMTWEGGFEGDSYLWHANTKLSLAGPENGTASLTESRLTVTFERALETPIDPGAHEVLVKLYDPTYYFAYFATHEPRIEGQAPETCRARIELFEPDSSLAALQSSLSLLETDETPEQEDVGALFADRIVMLCD